MVRRFAKLAVLAAASLLLLAGAAQAKGVWKIKGAGFGHGIGMSQYGAYGYAQHGFGYAAILAHYYTGTAIGAAPAGKTIRVLLLTTPSVSFSGATSACGATLNAGTTYTASRAGGSVAISGGGQSTSCSAPTATGPGLIKVSGAGTYHGSLELHPVGASLDAINIVDLEDYVKGVVPREMPSSWAPEALKVQAVASRSYALATAVASSPFDEYADTRSQVYGGAGAQTARTDAAVDATAGQIVTYAGKVATTYFFSTSGGHTENIENSFVGSRPVPYLKGVDDPYDSISPYHRWTVTLSQGRMQADLRRYLKGTLKAIKVNQRGVSPRIVHATIVGTGGKTKVTGPTLEAALGLRDTWAYFKRVKG